MPCNPLDNAPLPKKPITGTDGYITPNKDGGGIFSSSYEFGTFFLLNSNYKLKITGAKNLENNGLFKITGVDTGNLVTSGYSFSDLKVHTFTAEGKLNYEVYDDSTQPIIPNYGKPSSPQLPPPVKPAIPNPNDGLQDYNEIYKALSFILPPGSIKPALSANLGQDLFDGIFKLMDQFFPFLMLYKFFLPVLNMILCIIEVICAIPNPFKLIKAIKKLFRNCIPEFLALFPAFALIIMIISFLLVLLSLLQYIVSQVLLLIDQIIVNFEIMKDAVETGDTESILSCTKKFGYLLCSFQNLFVILSIFSAIIEIFTALINSVSKIPPCDENSDCCTTDVCPSFIRNNEEFSKKSGSFQYFNEKAIDSGISLPAGFDPLLSIVRPESWQFYDSSLSQELAFINITNAYDLPLGVNTVFFPTDATIDKNTPVSQAPYTVDMRLFYNPNSWGRSGDPLGNRFIRLKDAIVQFAPTDRLSTYNNNLSYVSTGVLKLVGGLFYEDDGTTPVNINGSIATIENFIHLDPVISSISPPLLPTDGYKFSDVEYTFKINHQVLLNKSLITLGCVPEVSLNKNFINALFSNVNLALLQNVKLPKVASTQDCITLATDAFRSNISLEGVAIFQASILACLSDLANQTNAALNDLIGIGFDQYKSTYSIDPTSQFTSRKIKISVQLKESNGNPLLNGPVVNSISTDISSRVKADITFGKVEPFTYDGYGNFISYISSDVGGSGTIKVSFDNKVISDIIIPSNTDINPTISERIYNYNFVFSPVATVSGLSDGDTNGSPRRDNSDTAGGV